MEALIRPDLAVLDDPQNYRSARSKTQNFSGSKLVNGAAVDRFGMVLLTCSTRYDNDPPGL